MADDQTKDPTSQATPAAQQPPTIKPVLPNTNQADNSDKNDQPVNPGSTTNPTPIFPPSEAAKPTDDQAPKSPPSTPTKSGQPDSARPADTPPAPSEPVIDKDPISSSPDDYKDQPAGAAFTQPPTMMPYDEDDNGGAGSGFWGQPTAGTKEETGDQADQTPTETQSKDNPSQPPPTPTEPQTTKTQDQSTLKPAESTGPTPPTKPTKEETPQPVGTPDSGPDQPVSPVPPTTQAADLPSSSVTTPPVSQDKAKPIDQTDQTQPTTDQPAPITQEVTDSSPQTPSEETSPPTDTETASITPETASLTPDQPANSPIDTSNGEQDGGDGGGGSTTPPGSADDDDKDRPTPAVKNLPKKPLPLLRIASLILAVVVVVGGAFLAFSKLKSRGSTTPPPTGQQAKQPPPESQITLTYWGLWEPEEVLRPLFDKFTQQTGIQVNYTQMEPRNYRLQLESAIKEGKGPDVFRFHNTWVPMLKEELADLPPDIFSPEEYSQTFYPVIVNDLTWEGKIKGIPLEIDGLVLFYNKDILAQKGLQESLPTNWDEFARLARQLTTYDTTGRIKVAGAALGTTNNVDHWSDIVGLMLYQNGVEMSNLAGSYDSKGRNLAADVLRYYTHFTTLSSPVWTKDLPPSTVMFADNRLAFYFGPSWRAFEFARLGVNFGITSVPKIPGDTSEWATYWVEGVSSSSPYQKQAWQLLKFMSSAENLQLFFNQAQGQRLFGEPYPRRDLNEALLTNPYLNPIGAAAENYKSWYLASFTHDQGINDRVIDFLGQAINQVLGQKKPESAISQAADEIYQVLNSWGVGQ